MLVKELIKELNKVDPNLPVVDFQMEISGEYKCGFARGYASAWKIEKIKLKKEKETASGDYYIKAKRTDKNILTAVRIRYSGSME
jgi:hypothetical protein